MKRILLVVCAWALLQPAGAAAVDCFELQQGQVRASVCRVNVKQERLQLFLQDGQGRTFGGFAGLERWLDGKGEKLGFAMNAGMYRPDYSPAGLYISEGHRMRPLVTANGHGNFYLKPNGVFLVSDAGARVVETAEYVRLREKVTLATQSGPLLLRHGTIHPAFRPQSDSRLIRNGVGVPSPDIALFAISDTPVNFYEFAVLFRDVLHCPDALYLDGNVSSLHAPQLGRSDRMARLGPILAVVEPRGP